MSISASPPPQSIGHRLKTEMQSRGVTAAQLARRADVRISFLYDILSGKSANPSPVKLARVATSLGVSIQRLLGEDETGQRPGDDYVTIPRIAVDASAGGGTLVTSEEPAESYYFRTAWIRDHLGTSPQNLRMLYISGDSMEPTLCHNDIILVDTTKQTPSPPGIFVLFDGMGLIAKRLEYVAHQKRLRIISDNPQYSTYERSIAEAIIVGRVVWFAREM